MKKQAEDLFRSRCQFEVSFRYDLFYSLNALLDPNSRVHSAWRKASLKILGKDFDKLLSEVGHSWEIWPVLAAILPGALSNPTFDELLQVIQGLPTLVFQEKIIRGLIHAEEAVALLLKKQSSLKAAISKVPKTKREWISHIGLFPYDPKSPQVIAVEALLANPEEFRNIVLRILKVYWEKSFRRTWECLAPQLRRSLEERERLFHSCSFAEFSKLALLRIGVDEEKGVIQAIRGGYRLRFADVLKCYFLPSAFNDRRFWSAFRDDGKGSFVYFPYFDPAITLDLQIASKALNVADPALDPALIFKALGDSTRFAIASVLARSPMSSVELAKTLSVSKPTISHHVHLLREAGLLQEIFLNGSVELRLKRSVLEKLSELTVAKLFNDNQPIILTRTRGGTLG
jgi:DNA-binding transcriptional ArsR family regulator